MFLKLLKISSGEKIIREISFRKGMNLIVDETPEDGDKTTGNNVGKTTILKLIDFCLGANQKIIYSDPESPKNSYTLVKDFLMEKNILITLVLKEDLERDDSQEIKIERNFLPFKKKIQRINGKNLTDQEFETMLLELIIPEQKTDKPTFRQIISHNVRYSDESISNTLKILNKFTSDAEYETLYLFLFGCKFDEGSSKQIILEKIRQENNFKKRLEQQQTKTAYETALSLIDSEIEKLDKRKRELNKNENFESDLDDLNQTKYKISKISQEITNITIRKDLIIEAEKDLNLRKTNIDLRELTLIYQQATNEVKRIQKTFDELVNYHNLMIVEKIKFIKNELPEIEKNLQEKQRHLKKELEKEKELTIKISKSDPFKELEKVIIELNENFRKKGEYEKVIQQLKEVETNLKNYEKELGYIDEKIFSGDFEQTVKDQLKKFNNFFSSISDELYGEQYAVKYDITTTKTGQKIYKFTSFNTNMSSGKKQGEISCFDIAYTLFADEEKISCLHFLLNDKKELMHDNQLVRIAKFADKNNIQFVASILKDKLPKELVNKEDYFRIKLSQKDKLFKIEKE